MSDRRVYRDDITMLQRNTTRRIFSILPPISLSPVASVIAEQFGLLFVDVYSILLRFFGNFVGLLLVRDVS